MSAKRTTLQDVANAAGVSSMSVSKALNNKGGISEDTKKHILEVARKLKYQPNLVAKSLRLDETKTLGVVLSDSSEMVVSKILRGIADCAEEEGYNIIISNTYSEPDRERRAVETLMSKCIDGLVLVASTLTAAQNAKWLKSLGLPTVLLMRRSVHAALDSVMNNNNEGGYQTVRHLLDQGCRRIGFISLTEISQSGKERMEGARRALAEAGVAFNAEHVLYATPLIQSGYEAAERMMVERWDCDALVCGCDLIAIGAIEAMEKAGIRVPGEIRVTGYDDIELAGYLRVPLTTMHQPLYEIGQKGVRLLLERMKFPEQPVQQIVLSSELVTRRSTMMEV